MKVDGQRSSSCGYQHAPRLLRLVDIISALWWLACVDVQQACNATQVHELTTCVALAELHLNGSRPVPVSRFFPKSRLPGPPAGSWLENRALRVHVHGMKRRSSSLRAICVLPLDQVLVDRASTHHCPQPGLHAQRVPTFSKQETKD